MTASRPITVDGLLLHGHDEVPDSLMAVAERWQENHGLVLARPAAPLLSEAAGPGRAWWRTGEEGPRTETLQDLLDVLGSVDPRHRSDVDQPLKPLQLKVPLRSAPERRGVLVAGFSQGAAVAVALAAAAVRQRARRRLRVVVVAGFLPEPLDVPSAPETADLRLLVITGEHDTVVDPFHGELLARRFRRRGWDVDECSHPGGHQWDGAVTDLASVWLADHLAPDHSTN